MYAAEVQVLGYSTKAQTRLRLCFVHFPGPGSSSDQVLGEHTLPRCSAAYHLPGSSHSVSRVCSGSTISGVLCVSSGELISGCNTPGGCQPSRIPGRLGWQLGVCSEFGGGCCLWCQNCPSPSGPGCRLPSSLPPVVDGPVRSRLALLWYSLSPSFCVKTCVQALG